MDKRISSVVAVCDHFVQAKTSFGRPDPGRTPFAAKRGDADRVGPTTLHFHPFVAMALYEAGRALGREDYVRAADLYTLYFLSCVRDPTGGRWDWYTEHFVQRMEAETGRSVRHHATYLFCRSWQIGIALHMLCRGLLAAHPGETSFHSKAAALYDWLGHFRTSRGPYYRIGYSPSGLPEAQAVDGAFSDDLGFVGRGLASYYDVTGRGDVLADLTGLAGYFLTPHHSGSDDGCFSEAMGSWVICPWPVEMEAEHVEGRKRLDSVSWVFSVCEATDFLTRLHGWTADGELRRRIQDRVVRSMKWVFDACQFEDGAVGVMGRDDAFTGTTGAAVMIFLDCRAARLLASDQERKYGEKARRAMRWLQAWSPEALVREAGHTRLSGGVTLKPPENLAWMLGWTVQALLRAEAL